MKLVLYRNDSDATLLICNFLNECTLYSRWRKNSCILSVVIDDRILYNRTKGANSLVLEHNYCDGYTIFQDSLKD